MSLDIWLQCECCGSRVYEGNITHNLGKMADEAGIYKCLWRAPENNFILAKQLISPLTTGLELLKLYPDRFKELNPPNGWGTYSILVRFVRKCLNACEKHPNAIIGTWR